MSDSERPHGLQPTRVTYFAIAFLGFLSKVNGSHTYALIAYVPFALVVIALPFVLALSAVLTAPFENKRNAKLYSYVGKQLDGFRYKFTM